MFLFILVISFPSSFLLCYYFSPSYLFSNVSVSFSCLKTVLLHYHWTQRSFHRSCGSGRINWSYASSLRRSTIEKKNSITVGQTSLGSSEERGTGGEKKETEKGGGVKSDREEGNILIKIVPPGGQTG